MRRAIQILEKRQRHLMELFEGRHLMPDEDRHSLKGRLLEVTGLLQSLRSAESLATQEYGV